MFPSRWKNKAALSGYFEKLFCLSDYPFWNLEVELINLRSDTIRENTDLYPYV